MMWVVVVVIGYLWMDGRLKEEMVLYDSIV